MIQTAEKVWEFRRVVESFPGLNSLMQGEFLPPGKDDEAYIRGAMEPPAETRG